MQMTSALLASMLTVVLVVPAVAFGADDAKPNGAPPVHANPPPVLAPGGERLPEDEDSSTEMLDRWREEDRVEHRQERREDRREERYEAEPPVVDDGSANGDVVAPAPHDTDDELDRDLELDDDES